MNPFPDSEPEGWYDSDRNEGLTVGVGVECLVGYVTTSTNSQTPTEKLDPWTGYLVKSTVRDYENEPVGATCSDRRTLHIVKLDNPEDINSGDNVTRVKALMEAEFVIFSAIKNEWEQMQLSGLGGDAVRSIVSFDALSKMHRAVSYVREEPETGILDDYNPWKDSYIIKPAHSAWEGDIQIRDAEKTGQLGKVIKSTEAYRTWHFRGIEINSPIYECSDPQFPDGDDSLEEHIMSLRLCQRLKVNASCEFQVNVGLDDAKSFSKITLKKLGTILWLAEDRLEMLTNPEMRKKARYRSLTKFSRLAQRETEAMRRLHNCSDADYAKWLAVALSPHNPLSGGTGMADKQRIEESLRLLWMANSAEDVRFLLEDPHPNRGRCSYHFQTRLSHYSKNTVEFKMMEGTLDPDLVGKWAKLCSQIVSFARDCDHKTFFYVCRDLLKERSPERLENHKNKNARAFTLWDFLGADYVNLSETHRKYWRDRVDDDEISNPNDHEDRLEEKTAVDAVFDPLREYRGDFVPHDVPSWYREV